MRRYWVLALVAVALLGMLAPPAQAQAPAPKVTINGTFIHLNLAGHNFGEAYLHRTGDNEFSTRSRGRVWVNGELGKAKAVLGLEIDLGWGQTGAADNTLQNQISTSTLAAGGSGTGFTAQRRGTSGGIDLNGDSLAVIEIKHLYTVFPVPEVPIPTTITMGLLPHAVTYKAAVLAHVDAAGVALTSTWTPNFKTNINYIQAEEDFVGGDQGWKGQTGFGRGDDFALFLTADYTPIKGLDVKPIYSLAYFQGGTSSAARQSPGGAHGAITIRPGHQEYRHTVGFDSRWLSGPWSLRPTFFYQFGTRENHDPTVIASNYSDRNRAADISAWFFDLAASYKVGPFLLEGRYGYASGNRPKDQLWKDVNYFQPISTDGGYLSDFSAATELEAGIVSGRALESNIGLERYGRQFFGLRGTYSVTPAVDLYAVASPMWTARSVDTDGTTATTGAITCATHTANSAAQPRGAGCNGDESYIGTEANLGLKWRFAPGLRLDLAGAWLFAGNALDTSVTKNGVLTKQDANDVYMLITQIRYDF